MKISHYFYGITALALILAIPAVSHSQTLMDTGAATGIGASLDNGPGTPGVGTMRDRIVNNLKARDENIKNNQNIRNNALGTHFMRLASTTSSTTTGYHPGPINGDKLRRGLASTTASTTDRRGPTEGIGKPNRGPVLGNGHGTIEQRPNASTTDRGDQATKNLPKVRKDIYDQQKNHLISQLNQALTNLSQVRGRIAERITKAETNGRDMTNAKALLITADAKLAAAKTAIDTLTNLKPITASTTDTASTTSSSIDLGKPRQVGAAAIKAIGDAKKALNDVVVAIAHSMGFKVGQDGTITATSTNSTTSTTTATSTP